MWSITTEQGKVVLRARENKTEQLFSIITDKYTGQVITEGGRNNFIITFLLADTEIRYMGLEEEMFTSERG